MHRSIVLLFVVVSLAGCASDDGGGGDQSAYRDGTEDEPQSDVLVETDEGVVVAENRGVVRGSVTNEFGFALADVRMALVGTKFSMDTGSDGKFLFENVTLGDHVLRAEHKDFVVDERSLTVKAASLTHVNITMVALIASNDNRPHLHDMWGSATELVVMDNAVSVVPPPTSPTAASQFAQASLLWPNFERRGNYDLYIPWPEEAPGGGRALVLPGTREIEVTFTWDAETTNHETLALAYSTPISGDDVYLEKHASGEPWTIPVEDPFSTDRGHQRFSHWEFFMNALNEVTSPTTYSPGYFQGELGVKIVIRKGEVLLEEAHPDFWGESNVVEFEGTKELNVAATVVHRSPGNGAFTVTPPGLFPPGTQRVQVEFSWQHATADGTVPGVPWVLTWRSADQHRYLTPFDQYHRAPPIEGSVEEQRLVYEFEVEPVQTDAYYADRSYWAFLISREGAEDDSLYLQEHRWRTGVMEFQFKYTVFGPDA